MNRRNFLTGFTATVAALVGARTAAPDDAVGSPPADAVPLELDEWSVALYSGDPDSGGVEVSYAGYARMTPSWEPLLGGEDSLIGPHRIRAITWPPAEEKSELITHALLTGPFHVRRTVSFTHWATLAPGDTVTADCRWEIV